jgi:hypothetical protein
MTHDIRAQLHLAPFGGRGMRYSRATFMHAACSPDCESTSLQVRRRGAVKRLRASRRVIVHRCAPTLRQVMGSLPEVNHSRVVRA